MTFYSLDKQLRGHIHAARKLRLVRDGVDIEFEIEAICGATSFLSAEIDLLENDPVTCEKCLTAPIQKDKMVGHVAT